MNLTSLSLAFTVARIILAWFYSGLAIYLWNPSIHMAQPGQIRQTYLQHSLHNFVFQEWQPQHYSTYRMHSRGCDFYYISVINGLVMEYKFPTDCCNLPTNLALSAIYWQVAGAVKDQCCWQHWVQSRVGRWRHNETARQLQSPEGTARAPKRCYSYGRGQRKNTAKQHCSMIGMSYFKDRSALKMPNCSPDFKHSYGKYSHTHMPSINQATQAFMVHF